MAMSTETTMMGKPYFVKPMKEMSYPSLLAMPDSTTLADAPTSVPLPPKHAPKEMAHHSGNTSMT